MLLLRANTPSQFTMINVDDRPIVCCCHHKRPVACAECRQSAYDPNPPNRDFDLEAETIRTYREAVVATLFDPEHQIEG